MRLFDDLSIFIEFATPLNRPNHSYTSLNQLARRARVGEDKLRRTHTRLGEAVNDPLIRTEGRKLILTPVGIELLTQAGRLLAVGKGQSEPNEVLAMGVAPDICPRLLTRPAAEFLREWAGLINLRIQPIMTETVREMIASGTIAFGVGWESDGAGTEHETLEPGLSWSVLVPCEHSLASVLEPISANQLSREWLFLPPGAANCSQLNSWFSPVPSSNRVLVDSVITARSMVAAGVGVALDVDFGSDYQGASDHLYRRLTVKGLERQKMVLYLPRNPADLSDPAKYFIESLRRVVQEIAMPLIPSLELPPPEHQAIPEPLQA